ncbi:MAG: NUDIX domain-containing protein [Pseudomonadota bacterium]
MSDFETSYVGQLRKVVGSLPLLVPGVRAVIEDTKGQLLLQRRSDFGIWGLPGGNFEFGEAAQEVLAREILEETGLRVSKAEVFGYSSNPEIETITFPNGDVCHFQVLLFHVTEFSGQLQHDAESLELRWVAKEGWRAFEMLANMAATLEAFRTYKAQGGFQFL